MGFESHVFVIISEIRQAMVKIMVPVAPRQEPGHLCIRGRLDTIISWGTFDNASGINQLPQDPSFATFWSAVALGALVKGCPFEAVRVSRFASVALHRVVDRLRQKNKPHSLVGVDSLPSIIPELIAVSILNPPELI